MLRCGGNHDVGKSRRMSEAARPIRQRAGDPRGCRIEGENAIAVEMQDCIKPGCQISALARGTLAPQLGDSILDLGYRDGLHEPRDRMRIHPFYQCW